MKTIKFYTLGCKVNQYDTQAIRERFIQAGFRELNNGSPSDIYLVNTCTVTSLADRKSRQLIRNLNKENPQGKIIVTGCLVEKDAKFIADIKGVDFIIAKRFFPEGIQTFSKHTRAFLKIQDGCDNFCSYCKVPYVRGLSRSRPLSEIIQEAERLVREGFKELVLCGICLGSYGKDASLQSDLVNVVEALERIEGLLRIRLSSIEVVDVTDSLIKRLYKSNKLCPHLHIPVQSGDDEILKKMNRNYTRTMYLKLINKIRKVIPYIAITTDVLVGFPSETENNFRNTVSLIKEIIPLKVHIFPYSPREGTAAALDFKNEVAPAIIKQRAFYLKKVARSRSFKYRQQFLNKDVDVLIEGASKYKQGFQKGHTDTYIKILIKTDTDFKNKLIRARLHKVSGDTMIAFPLDTIRPYFRERL